MITLFKWLWKTYKDIRAYLLALDAKAEEKLFQGPDYIYITIGVSTAIIVSYFFADIENPDLWYCIKGAIRDFDSYRNYLVPYDINPYAYYHPKFWWDPYVMDGEMAWESWWDFDVT